MEKTENDVDDQFRSLMEGLRTTLPGVQVLFAFLLVLPLQASFGEIRDVERIAYYVSFFGSAMASVLLIAPSAHQRLRAPVNGVERRSERHLQIAVSLTIAGTIIFADLQPGTYRLVTGLWDGASGERMRALDAAGQPTGLDGVVLTDTFTVAP